jgi:hypothetical protein
MSESLINDELAILCGPAEAADLDKVARHARTEWASLYGDVRTSGNRRPDRMDTGVKRESTRLSERLWIGARRAKVESLLQHGVATDTALVAASSASAANLWTESHDKEKSFQLNKCKARRVQALDEGHLLPGEVTQALRRSHAIATQKEIRRRRHYNLDHAAKRKALAAPVRPTLCGLSVWPDPAVALLGPHRPFIDALVKANLGLCNDAECHMAQVFLVQGVNHASELVRWCAILGGGILCDLKCILNEGLSGKSLKFMAAVAQKRKIWVTPGFAEENPLMNRALSYWVDHPISTWSRASSAADIIRRGEIQARHRRAAQVILFVTAQEQVLEDPSYYWSDWPACDWPDWPDCEGSGVITCPGLIRTDKSKLCYLLPTPPRTMHVKLRQRLGRSETGGFDLRG